ncbi:MAG: SDR family NAD(P)-dependent oxidoreductase [Rhodothermales bacterium]
MGVTLNNRVVLITGSTTGLGKAMALEFAHAGARVVMNYHNNQQRAEASFAELSALGAPCMLTQSDVTEEQSVERMYKSIHDTLGPVDILIPNATPAQPQNPIEDYDWPFYQSMIDFFLKSPYLLTTICLPHMKRQKWGRIINITSEVFSLGVAPFTAYVAAKGAQVGFSRSLATELASFGITVNMISPGWIPVERHEKDPQEVKDMYLASIPAGRWGLPKDVASAALYLASEESAFVTGQTIAVNGGKTFH